MTEDETKKTDRHPFAPEVDRRTALRGLGAVLGAGAALGAGAVAVAACGTPTWTAAGPAASSASKPAPPPRASTGGKPPIDALPHARLQTATFALG